VVTPTDAGPTDANRGRTAADPSDPGARLLLRVGDFIEPLTRFSRSNLSMTESRHEAVPVMVRQVFRVVFETKTSDGNGPLPVGVKEVADARVLGREGEAQLAAARIALPRRLSAWAETHGEEMTARPTVDACFGEASPLGHVEPCAVCNASGRITCSLCHGEKQVICEACGGHGARDCETCHKAGTVTCKTCRGVGTVTERRQRKKWDEAADDHYVEHYQETLACPACNKLGVVKCPKCAGVGEMTCKTCEGRKTVACSQCKGTGSTRCETCEGHGKRHHVMTLACSINETVELAPRAANGEIAATIKARGGVEEILGIASSRHSTAEASSDTVTRDTIAVVPVTSVMVTMGDKRAMVHAFGERQEVPDYKNIAGLLMADDIAELESANAETQLLPPEVPERIYGALSMALASEANVELVTTGAGRGAAETARNYRGVMTADYVTRACEAIRKGVSRAYWAGIVRGPALVLFLPVLFAPLDLFLRNGGAGVRVGVLLALMALTAGGAMAGHYWVIRQLQRRIAPVGAPKLKRIVDSIGLTTTWLVTGGAVAVLLTLLVAGMTSWIFPPR
jgi:hypothetical protein